MAFESERELEAYIRKIIDKHVTFEHPNIYALENKKAVDILICKDGPEPALFFIETKFHKINHGRLGFGSRNGGGFQPEIVRRKPEYFERNLRWVLASEKHEPEKVLFIPSDIIRQYVSGSDVGDKFNNIQPAIFQKEPMLSETQFIQELTEWLGVTSAKNATSHTTKRLGNSVSRVRPVERLR